ncbi:MAG TPA: Rnase Y domain-containing protein, partial [Propionibacteriaceae bacterium]|nr:Rnase Y domain-containing protein [Propionibacteriaceae bacterium]
MTGVFQALVVVGLFLLTAVVALATAVMVRRGQHNNTGGHQSGTAHSTGSTLLSSPGASGTLRTQTDRPAADSDTEEQSASEAELEDLRAKAKTLLASAQSARAEAEEESRARRNELRELRADLERREQRLSDREERLDNDVRGLEDKTRQLEELKNDLKNEQQMLADLEAQQQVTLERLAGLTAEQAKSELVASVTHDAKRQAVLLARDIERQAVREADSR